MRIGTNSVLVGVAAVVGMGCGNTDGVECSCGDPRVTLDVPADRAAEVVQVEVSGTACEGVVPTCDDAGGGCTTYTFAAPKAGVCDVDVLFSSGGADFHTEITFASLACCPFAYAQPNGAAQIDVPDVYDGGAG